MVANFRCNKKKIHINLEDVTVDFICYSKYSRWGKYQILLTGIDFLNLKKKYQQHSGRGINISRIWTSKKKNKKQNVKLCNKERGGGYYWSFISFFLIYGPNSLWSVRVYNWSVEIVYCKSAGGWVLTHIDDVETWCDRRAPADYMPILIYLDGVMDR